MNTLRRTGVLALALMLIASSGFADDSASLKVAASRALSLAVVDLDRKNPASDALHDAFKESLSYEMSQLCQMPTPIKPVKLDAARAGWGLGTGTYDAAVVIGGTVPKAMISSGFTVTKATPASGDPKRMICLVTRNEDPGLAKLLAQSFPEALKGPFFQKALLRYSGAPETEATDWKIAGLAN
ncbi:hypothetical protein Verru16b_01750 [Lacunisphaera limnophila]|uniref:Uncharacterized protein n=1 Tax=Lacunisphaera limnophila TaxID=1838286 RepID=A0A1D8AUW9_9BACT|nr:hypothetical protein [Lacunisphaera limnophila]AOS44683.1 hypothetical protein Verru16b_01750 [Lacunisphaera limnophila]